MENHIHSQPFLKKFTIWVCRFAFNSNMRLSTLINAAKASVVLLQCFSKCALSLHTYQILSFSDKVLLAFCGYSCDIWCLQPFDRAVDKGKRYHVNVPGVVVLTRVDVVVVAGR
jgi:hypothetical protein